MSFPTLDVVFIPIKIKIVGIDKPSSGAGMQSRRFHRRVRPVYDMRIQRDHGGGLWTIESFDGQLYLAVLSPLSDEIKRRRLQERRVPMIDSGHPDFVEPA